MSELPDYNKISFPENPAIPFEEILPDAAPEALDLVKQFLVYPAKERISAVNVRNGFHSAKEALALIPL